MMSQKNTDIVPISFIAGTGGRFISYLLNSAKCNTPVQIQFSNYGNAHDIWNLGIEIAATPYDCAVPIDKHVSFFMQELENKKSNYEFTKNNPLPYYGSCHINNIEELLLYFNKAVHISYDVEDIHTISLILLGKQMIDQCNENQILRLNHFYRAHIATLNSRLSMRKPRYDLEPNLLNLSWQDIFKNDPVNLFEKLSAFSNIPFKKFKLTDLLEWRRRTNMCVSDMSNLIKPNATHKII